MKAPNMKRRLLIVAVFLLTGAVMNVAVAWTCAARSVNYPYSSAYAEAPSEEDARSIVESMNLFDEPFHLTGLDAYPAFGVTRTVIAVVSGGTDPSWAAILHTRSGWPITSLRGDFASVSIEGTPSQQYSGSVPIPKWLMRQDVQRIVVPLRPIWAGFIANTMFYATVLWLLICGPFVLRRVIRLKRGRCPACAYPVGESGVCSECGKALL